MKLHGFQAAILDTDGVITQTATTHARAWKIMFDEYLAGRPNPRSAENRPFEDADYLQYVDGKPRYDGVRSFLESRGIELPFGDEKDTPNKETICGLGNRKNAMFHELVASGGVEVYQDTVAQIDNWKRQGVKVAVISSSRNCEAILKAAGLLHRFDAKVDGNDAKRLAITGKPAPDIFLAAARQLGVDPAESLIVEDAISGVQAGRNGRFGLVVGVDRDRAAAGLWKAGADCVVRDLRELETARHCPPGENCLKSPSSALAHARWIAGHLGQRRLALFLDYDGTLTPIVRRPELAVLSDDMRRLLRQLGEQCTVAIVSGRDRRNVEQMVDVDNLVYAGSHGFDIRGPGGLAMEHEEAQKALGDLDEAEQKLRERIRDVGGAHVERKKFAIAVHYREVPNEADVERLEHAVDEVRGQHPRLRKLGGKKIFELQPDVEWHKGYAVMWLAEALGLAGDSTTIVYIGDDETDENAFRELRYRGVGIGILVGEPADTCATYYLRDCDEAYHFLKSLSGMLHKSEGV